jgi:hypothetical protein
MGAKRHTQKRVLALWEKVRGAATKRAKNRMMAGAANRSGRGILCIVQAKCEACTD